ncbi:MAG: glucosamine-6-phosphate deaminase, partial [Flavobacteriaceae bacterium]|nr:glucosamine-6-phosphate deaminase [Flavobacteriaceae bacterium]
PGGKPGADDSTRPERKSPSSKRVIIFSPHPDDDVISMGGTLARLINQNHDLYVAYQTSGNIAVSDEDARRYVDVSIATSGDSKKMNSLKLELTNKKEGTIDSTELNKLKGDIRKSECFAAARVLNLKENSLHFLNLPFYQTRKVEKKDPSQKDINIVRGLIEELKPHQIFAAGDLADPHGTHKICLDILFEAISEIKNKSFMKDCWLWLYRGAWQEWDINEIDMAVPMSPEQVVQKRNSILSHQSQKDKVMYQGQDKRDFWLRAEERNRNTAIIFNKLGLTEYQAIEAFKRHEF